LIKFVDTFLRSFHKQLLFSFQIPGGRSLTVASGSLVQPSFLALLLATPPNLLTGVSAPFSLMDCLMESRRRRYLEKVAKMNCRLHFHHLIHLLRFCHLLSFPAQ
jgi:hypothetical protein